MMVGLLRNFAESLIFQLSYDNGPGPPPDDNALTFTSPKMLQCTVSMVISLIARSVSALRLLHFQFFTPCTHNTPHMQKQQWRA